MEITTKAEVTTKSEVVTKTEGITKAEPSFTEETTVTHIHSFSVATCTEAEKCSCGVTNGSAKGHHWQEANCTTAKTCLDCGVTEGSFNGHSYSGGKCSVCGIDDPDYNAGPMVWISKTGSKYHIISDCSGMKNPSQITLAEAQRRNIPPCSNCCN